MDKQSSDYSSSDNEEKAAAREEKRIREHRHNLARAMAKMEGMKVVVNALVGALPSIFNVLLVCLIFWLIFAIIGVNMFMGRFYKCIDTETGAKFSQEIIPNKTVCLMEKHINNNADWINARVTFDNTAIAYLALFQYIMFIKSACQRL